MVDHNSKIVPVKLIKDADDHRCNYCNKEMSMTDLVDADRKIEDFLDEQDSEALELVYDALPSGLSKDNDPIYSHEGNGGLILNLCQDCFDKAVEKSRQIQVNPSELEGSQTNLGSYFSILGLVSLIALFIGAGMYIYSYLDPTWDTDWVSWIDWNFVDWFLIYIPLGILILISIWRPQESKQNLGQNIGGTIGAILGIASIIALMIGIGMYVYSYYDIYWETDWVSWIDWDIVDWYLILIPICILIILAIWRPIPPTWWGESYGWMYPYGYWGGYGYNHVWGWGWGYGYRPVYGIPYHHGFHRGYGGGRMGMTRGFHGGPPLYRGGMHGHIGGGNMGGGHMGGGATFRGSNFHPSFGGSSLHMHTIG
jgi:hypothetical protein